MTLTEYLAKKYAGRNAKALSHGECQLFGIPWPLIHGWPGKYADLEVDYDAGMEAASRRIKKASAPPAQPQVPRESKKEKRKRLRAERLAHAREKKAKRRIAYQPALAATDAFLESYEWRRVRMQVLKRDGARCACCGATPADGAVMNVDHIKPRRLFPQLALDLSNLQVLCNPCNHGKGNWDQTDWRTDQIEESNVIHLRSILKE